MATFIVFGRYSVQAIQGMSAERTAEAAKLIAKFGGEVKAMYALLGKTDLLAIVEFPGVEQAMQASAALTKLTGISFTTSPAVSVEEFDRLMAEV
jgi:uncharacterized protein with GYD domain